MMNHSTNERSIAPVKSENVTMPASIFREYDVRGQAIALSPQDELTLTPDLARAIGQALGSRHPEESKVLITGDNRLSTPGLRNGLAEGLSQAGINAFIGSDEMPTGGASWVALTDDYAMVVQVTGSHT